MGAAASMSPAQAATFGHHQYYPGMGHDQPLHHPAAAPRLCSTLILTQPLPHRSQSASSALSSPSLSALQDVVLQTVCTQELRRFALSAWRPGCRSDAAIATASRTDDAYFLQEGNTIALNCIDFVSEATDFALIPNCGFQYYRACHIFEKFLMRGAARLVPLSSGLQDDCSAALFGGRSDESCCSASLFAGGVAEALDFLLAEVCPSFQTDVPLQALGQALGRDLRVLVEQRRNDITGTEAGERAGEDGKTCDESKSETVTESETGSDEGGANYDEVLIADAFRESCVYLEAALDFATSKSDRSGSSGCHLEGALRALASLKNTAKLICALQEAGGRDELSMVAFLHHLHRLYTAHLLPGGGKSHDEEHDSVRSSFSCLKLAAATKGDFLLRVAKCASASADVLIPLEMDILQQLSEILPRSGFLQSEQHRRLLRGGHMLLASSPSSCCCEEKRGVNHRANDSALVIGAGAGGDEDVNMDNEDTRANTREKGRRRLKGLQLPLEEGGASTSLLFCSDMTEGEAKLCDEILQFLGSGHDAIFGQYLDAAHQEMPLMHFCQSVLRYQYMKASPTDTLAECTNIFERYLSCNAAEQMKLPESITRGITRHMFKPDTLLFTEALRFVLRYLAQHRWPAFKRDLSLLPTLPFTLPVDYRSELERGKQHQPLTLEALSAAAHATAAFASLSRTEGQMTMQMGEGFTIMKTPPNTPASAGPGLASRGGAGMGISRESSIPPPAPSSPKHSQQGKWLPPQLWQSHLLSVVPLACEGTTVRTVVEDEEEISSSGSCCSEKAIRKSSIIYRKDGKRYTDGIRFEDILNRSHCLTIFKAFLDTEGTSQTLLFLIEVEEFIKIPEIGFQQNRARKIFFKFIHSKAIMAVPINPETRKVIQSEFVAEEISALIFTKAVQEVRGFVENNQFPRFMQSAAAGKVRDLIQAEEIPATPGTCLSEEEVYIPYLRRNNLSQDTWEAKTLEDMADFKVLLKHPTAVRFFKDFCVRSHCNENLFFWLDTNNYTQLPGSDFRKRVAAKLYKKYIAEGAPLQVNISGRIRVHIRAQLGGPCPSAGRLVFGPAQDEVFALMLAGTFPAFLQSKEYLQLSNYFKASASSSSPM